MGSRAEVIARKFAAALDRFVAEVRHDRAILAAILCGSLSHDAVWAGSDIDLVLVTIDDRTIAKASERGLSIAAGDVNIHAILVPRSEFRRIVEGAAHHSFMHSFLAKGRLLYTHDPTIDALCGRLAEIGARDTELQLLRAGTSALPALYKAHKFFVTRGDLEYTALWILHAAGPLARVEVISRGLLADREVLPQAMALNPDAFRPLYVDLLNAKKTRDRVQAALDAADGYLEARAPRLFAPILEYLRDAGDARAASEMEEHFARHFGVEHVTTACEYLADRGRIGKAAVSTRLTTKSTVAVQELAFFAIEDAPSRLQSAE